MRQLINTAAEQALLGSVILDNTNYFEIAESLEVHDFALSSHRQILQRMADLNRLGSTIDPLTLKAELGRHGELDSIGGEEYLASLTIDLPRFNSIASWVEMVRELSGIRQALGLGKGFIASLEDPRSSVEDVIGHMETGLLEFRSGSKVGRADTRIAAAIPSLLDRMKAERTRGNKLLGLPSGITNLDQATRGFQEGEITVLGARTGVGKSVVMVQAAIANCRNGTPVLLASLEMSRQQLLRRICAAVSGVAFQRLIDPALATDADMAAITAAMEEVDKWPLHIVDDSGLTIDKLVAIARQHIRRHGVKLIAVDYVQIVRSEGKDERLRIAGVSRALTRLAKDEGVPVLALSQLARSDRSSAERPPTLSDLRETSQLENDAHVVVLLHRPWDEAEGRHSAQTEIIIAKHRSGETAIFTVTFNRRTLTFVPTAESRPR